MMDYFRITKKGSERTLSEWAPCSCEAQEKEHYHVRALARIVNTKTWKHVAYTARLDFHPRCQELRIPVPSWHRFDRLLGREICLLFWATENQPPENVEIICRNWLELSPPERWWLFMYALSGDGWRRALPLMLGSDETAAIEKTKEISKVPTWAGLEWSE